MAGLEILNLKLQYLRSGIKNKQKYNLNFGRKFNKHEIGTLMANTGVTPGDKLRLQQKFPINKQLRKRINIHSSDGFFNNPQNTQIEVFAPREYGPTQQQWYIQRSERYTDGSYSTIMHKEILSQLNQSRVVIVKYDINGKESNRYDFFSDNTQKNADI